MSKHRTFTPEFKAQVVLEVLSGAKTTAQVCREHDLSAQVVNHWKAEFIANAPKLFQAETRTSPEQARIAELERLVGRLTMQLEIAKKVSGLLKSQRRRDER